MPSLTFAVPPVNEVVRWPRRASSDCSIWAAPSVNDVVSEPSRVSMVSVTDLDRVSNVCSSDFILVSSEVSR